MLLADSPVWLELLDGKEVLFPSIDVRGLDEELEEGKAEGDSVIVALIVMKLSVSVVRVSVYTVVVDSLQAAVVVVILRPGQLKVRVPFDENTVLSPVVNADELVSEGLVELEVGEAVVTETVTSTDMSEDHVVDAPATPLAVSLKLEDGLEPLPETSVLTPGNTVVWIPLPIHPDDVLGLLVLVKGAPELSSEDGIAPDPLGSVGRGPSHGPQEVPSLLQEVSV